MGVLSRLRRWLTRSDTDSRSATSADTRDREGSAEAAGGDSSDDELTRIEDAAATSLRAIKLSDSERETLDAESRDR
jgi:hypothetical protein